MLSSVHGVGVGGVGEGVGWGKALTAPYCPGEGGSVGRSAHLSKGSFPSRKAKRANYFCRNLDINCFHSGNLEPLTESLDKTLSPPGQEQLSPTYGRTCKFIHCSFYSPD